MRGQALRVACGIWMSFGCGGESIRSPSTTPEPGGAGGTSYVGGNGGNGGSSMPVAGMTGVGAVAGQGLHPPPTVELEACAHVSDADTDANRDCFACCWAAGFPNLGYFDGKCVCGMPAEGTGSAACVSEPTNAACSACCTDRGFRGQRFDQKTQDSCECIHHVSSSICAAAFSEPEPSTACAICCINAGYIGSGLNGACVCSDP